MYTLNTIKKEAITSLKKAIGKAFTPTIDMLERPPRPEYGDLSFPCFALAKGMKRNPAEIASELAAKMAVTPHIKAVTSAGPYVNFTFAPQALAEHVLQDVLKQKARYGKSTTGKGVKVLVEFANLNTHKEVHVGHLRNLSLGQAVTSILALNGYEVTPISYINDLGNNVAKCLWGLKNLHEGEEPEEHERLNFLGRVYSEATAAIGEDEAKREEVSRIQRELENMEGEWVALWKKTQKWSIDGLKTIYDNFGLTLDHVYLEHQVIEETHAIVKKLLTDGIARVSEGAVIVDLEAEGLGVNLLRKSDGTLLYNAKDLALAYRKEADYAADRSIVVVDNRQTLAFKQLSATLKRMQFPREVLQLGYDIVTLPEGAMSSRKGNIVRWSDLGDAMLQKFVLETKARHEDWSAKKIMANAKALVLASVKFVMLRQDPEKVLVFDMEEAMATEGFTGPYVLYTVARIESIKRKAEIAGEQHAELLTHPLETELLREMARFPEVVLMAGAQFRPSVIAQYAFELAQLFAKYYETVHVLQDEDHNRMAARLALLEGVRQTLHNALSALNIQAVKEM